MIVKLQAQKFPVAKNLFSEELLELVEARRKLGDLAMQLAMGWTVRRVDAQIMGREFNEAFPQEAVDIAESLWPDPVP